MEEEAWDPERARLQMNQLQSQMQRIQDRLREHEEQQAAERKPVKMETEAVDEERVGDDFGFCHVCHMTEGELLVCEVYTTYIRGSLIRLWQGCECEVHAACYNVTSIPEGPWYCDTCTAGHADPVCSLCHLPSKGGLVLDARGKTAHPYCVMWIPETYFVDGLWQGAETINKAREALKCIFCSRSGAGSGPKVQCAHKKCTKAFHPQCHAIACGVLSDLENMQMYCPSHAPLHLDAAARGALTAEHNAVAELLKRDNAAAQGKRPRLMSSAEPKRPMSVPSGPASTSDGWEEVYLRKLEECGGGHMLSRQQRERLKRSARMEYVANRRNRLVSVPGGASVQFTPDQGSSLSLDPPGGALPLVQPTPGHLGSMMAPRVSLPREGTPQSLISRMVKQEQGQQRPPAQREQPMLGSREIPVQVLDSDEEGDAEIPWRAPIPSNAPAPIVAPVRISPPATVSQLAAFRPEPTLHLSREAGGSMVWVGHFVLNFSLGRDETLNVDLAATQPRIPAMNDHFSWIDNNSPSMLLSELVAGRLHVEESHGLRLLEAVRTLQSDRGCFGNALLQSCAYPRALCLNSANAKTAPIRFDIYFGTGNPDSTIMGLRSDYDCWFLMEHLSPAVPVTVITYALAHL